MKNQLFNKRIPTILGIGLVVLGVILTTVIARTQTSLNSNASNSEEPQNVKITNLSDDSFTITYQTSAVATGSVNYGKDKGLGNTELDHQDKEKGEFSPKNIHSITLKKLSPSKKYFFVIISGQNTFLSNGIPFETLTAPNISSPSASQTAVKGKIVLPDGNSPNEALVYLNTDDSQLLSTSVAKDGKFNLSLKSLRSKDLSSYLEINDSTILNLLAVNSSLKSTIITPLSHANSMPTITLSNNYDFIDRNSPIASNSAESSGFPSTAVKENSQKPQILTPKNNQSFIDQQPQFRGTSLPNEEVEIIIHSNEDIQTQVTADRNGNWTYRPPTSLSPGDHTITIKTRDSSGILTVLMQSFTVFASGTQVAEAATPSATPTQKITPTSIPTIVPTSFPSPTIMPTIISTEAPIPTAIPIGAKGGIPPTGDSRIIPITIASLAMTAIGIVLFLLTRSGIPL